MGKRFDTLLFPGNRKKAFTLSYDDGVLQDVRLLELLKKYGLKGTFNLNYGVTGYESLPDRPFSVSRVKREDIRELYKDQEIGGHGLYHSDLTGLGTPYASYEILEDKRGLEEITGGIVDMFAYPFGLYNEEVKDLLKSAGYKGARTVTSTHSFALPSDPWRLDPTCHHNDEKLMELADQFLSMPSFRTSLFYVWGHAYEFDRDGNWDQMEAFLAKMAGHDDIWYAANGEILRYLEAYKMLEYSVDGSLIRNPSSIDVLIGTSFGTTELLKAGTTTRVKDTPL